MERNYNKLISVNSSHPIDNQSFTFLIPPNTSDHSLDFNVKLPTSLEYYRYISQVDFRIDTSGIYNVMNTQIISFRDETVLQTLIIEHSLYNLDDVNNYLDKLIKPINESGPNAFKALPLDNIISFDLTQAKQIQKILGWVQDKVNLNTGEVLDSNAVNITVDLDFLLVYTSITRQSTENNTTNTVAIPISGTISRTESGSINTKVPIL